MNEGSLHGLDAQLDGLRARFPGWRIWYVRPAVGRATWHGHRLPELDADSADQLAEYMTQVDGGTWQQ